MDWPEKAEGDVRLSRRFRGTGDWNSVPQLKAFLLALSWYDLEQVENLEVGVAFVFYAEFLSRNSKF